MYSNKWIPRFKPSALLMLIVIALTQIGCSSVARSNGSLLPTDNRRVDLSKIYIDFITSTSDAISIETRKNLKTAIRQQLLNENLLQEDAGVHSLSLKCVILSYENNILEVQAELYDDHEFLVYSRIRRQIAVTDNWELGLQLVAEQILDELMTQMKGRAAYMQQLRPQLYDINYMYVGGGAYYGSWGWWRQHRDHDRHDRDTQQPPEPRPPKHWVSDAIYQALPRSHEVADEKSSRERPQPAPAGTWSVPSSHRHEHSVYGSGSSGGSNGGFSGSNSGSSWGSSNSSSGPGYAPSSDSGSSSGPSFSAPQSHQSEPSSSRSSRRSSSGNSDSSYSAPQSHRPAPQPSAPRATASPSSPSTGSIGSAAPSSRQRKHEREH
ncbi:MAG: hypothetical protein ABL925_09300 [Methylococcales bacterium]